MENVYIDCGKETIGGTGWPVECKVERATDIIGKPIRWWLVTIGICNGTAKIVYYTKTKRLGVELAEAWRDDTFLFQELIDRHLYETKNIKVEL